MYNVNEIRVVLGSLRYKSAPNTDFSLKVPLVQTTKLNVEFDRTADVNLQQLYDDERQASTIFRPSCKFQILFKNSYAGVTDYNPFKNNMYYLNEINAANIQCGSGNPSSVPWTGLPQYNEFDFIRNDYNVSGYTQPPNNHLLFNSKSASTYNWSFYISYPFSNDSNKFLEAIEKKSSQTLSWISGDGIPFVIEKTVIYGRNLISFRCPVKHGLAVNEFVKFNFNYNGDSIFKVDSLGVETYGSEDYVFNIIDIGYTGTTFSTGVIGTFKRIILESNTADTTSIYYVRKHKILTDINDTVTAKSGFEENIFGIRKKYEKSSLTPNGVNRVSIKEGCQSYTLSFNKDIDLNNLLDNLGRPITRLYPTVIWKGYFGWTLGQSSKLKQGYEFNLPLDLSTNEPSTWWEDSNSSSDTNFTLSQWNNLSNNFYYNESLKPGDTLDGDFCEWNNFEQKERVISTIHHKIKFNSSYFNIQSTFPSNQMGYYYRPLYSMKIKDYSDYIENGDPQNIDNLPNYAYYSTTLKQFIWRDIFTYGFIDTINNLGVNYPFLNGAHYPYENFIFRIIPEGTNYIEQTVINLPIIDECE